VELGSKGVAFDGFAKTHPTGHFFSLGAVTLVSGSDANLQVALWLFSCL